jgi:hypothetical protein
MKMNRVQSQKMKTQNKRRRLSPRTPLSFLWQERATQKVGGLVFAFDVLL